MAATVTLAAWLVLPGGTAPGQSGDDLRSVELSTTTFREGEVVTLSGTGCVDPETDSGEGLAVILRRPADLGRGGTSARLPTIEAPVDADGTFSGSGTIAQPLFPDGAQTALVTCERPNDVEADIEVFSSREVQITVEPPALPDLEVAAGSALELELPCEIADGGYGFFRVSLRAPGQADVDLFVPDPSDPGPVPLQGDTVALAVSADVAPRTYDATAACAVAEGGIGAYYAGFEVTVRPPSGGAAEAGSSDAVTGQARYTG